MCEDHFKKHFKFCQLCCTIDIIICDSSNSYQKLDNFKVLGCKISVYHLASYSFWGNSSSLNLAIVANSITVFLHIVSAETILFWSQYINVRKLFKGGNYSKAETIWGNTVTTKWYQGSYSDLDGPKLKIWPSKWAGFFPFYIMKP